MILDQTTVVRLMVIETIEDLGMETTTLTVTLTEEITPLIIKGILIRIGIQIKDMVTEPVYREG